MTAATPHPSPPRLDPLHCPLQGTQLIEASAGTGKTWAICALVLRLLVEARLDIGQVLVVTFTNAAAAELRERLRARLALAVAEWQVPGSQIDAFVTPWLTALRAQAPDDAEVGQRLEAALRGFDDAAVSTIHGFCQRALGDAAFSAGMPLALEATADDNALRRQVVNDFWRREVAGATLPVALARHLLDQGDSPERWAAILGDRLRRPLAQPCWPQGIDDETAVVRDDAVEALTAAYDDLRALWHAERDEITAHLLDNLSALSKTSYQAESVAVAVGLWDTWFADGDAFAVPADRKLRLLTARKIQDATKKGRTAPRHACFDEAQRLIDAVEAIGSRLALGRLRLLRRLLATAPGALAALKRTQRVIAFDDMLANLHQRLAGDGGEALAAALRQRYPAALIDEFQDTDPLQWAIFQRVHGSAGLPLFLVGDPKQAIYSFRNADLATYLAARDQAHGAHTLVDNQRACRPLIEAVNTLFRGHALPFMQPGLDHHDAGYGAKPRPSFVDTSGGETAALQLWRLPRDADGALPGSGAAREAAAQATAAEIARLLAAAARGRVTVDGVPLAAHDIAVLVRSHTQAAVVRAALARHGVGSAMVSQDSVFASPDAEDLATLLAAVLEPTREPLVKAALATVTLGLDADALLALAADEAAWVARVQRLADWRRVWVERGVGTMLRRMMADETVPARLLTRADGERRLTNLQHLAECLHQAAPAQGTPEGLLRWLQAQRRDARADEAAQLRLEADRHLVQIVTIHRSKGLEYGLVFCPFLWAPSPAPRSGEPEVWRDGDGVTWLDFRRGLDEAFPADRIKADRRLDAAAEELRLVYVALTRAVHRCVLVVGAWGSGPKKSAKTAARGALGWLAAGRGADPAAWLDSDSRQTPWPDADGLDAAWERLAAAAAPNAALAPLPGASGPAVPLSPTATDADGLAALPPPDRLPRPTRIGSYSGLVHGARHELAAQDHDSRLAADTLAIDDDEGAPAPAASPGPLATDPDDPLAFPRGPAAGDCLHAVFEAADFTDPAGWDAAIADALTLHGPAIAASQRRPLAPEPDRWARQLRRTLDAVLATPIPLGGASPLRLGQLPRQRRLTELAFHLPVPTLAADDLNRLLAHHGYAMPALAFPRLRGWLKGFMDLVLCHEGRWWVLDWKSNHLGDTAADYGGRALDDAMAREGYHLQHLLYTVALHRWLALRLPGYDPAQHLGGALYLFVRGVRPEAAWRQQGAGRDGLPGGVWRHTPALAAIDALSGLLAGPGGAR